MLEASGAAGGRGVRGHDEAGEPDGIEFNEKKNSRVSQRVAARKKSRKYQDLKKDAIQAAIKCQFLLQYPSTKA